MDAPYTLPFDRFWGWLVNHPNCIVRVGTPEAVLYDDEDIHWIFGVEDDRTLLVQALRGKRLVGELLVERDQVAYAEAVPQEQADEHVFELISETEADRFAAYFFVLSHGFDPEGAPTGPRVH